MLAAAAPGTQAVKPEQRQRIVDRHRDALLRHGHSPQALYWSSEEVQQLRFRMLLEIGVQGGDSLLDVGCGFGDLYPLLNAAAPGIRYTGLDLSPDLIATGRELYPQAEFFHGDLFDLDPAANSYDLVLLSGALNEQLHDGGAYARATIKRMYETCRRGVAFNLLNAENGWIASRTDLQSFLPEEIRTFCAGFCPHVVLRKEYLDNDFTLHLFNGRQALLLNGNLSTDLTTGLLDPLGNQRLTINADFSLQNTSNLQGLFTGFFPVTVEHN